MKSQLNLIKWDLNGNFMGFIFVFNGILDGIYGGIRIHFMVYPLVICSIAMQSGWKWTIYFDDLPRKNGQFPGVVLNYQRICCVFSPYFARMLIASFFLWMI